MSSTHKKHGVSFSIPASVVRIGSGLLLALVIYWLGSSLDRDDLALAGRSGTVVHFHGFAAWLIAASLFCFAAFVVSWLSLHKYRIFRRCLLYAACSFFIIGIVVGIWSVRHKSTMPNKSPEPTAVGAVRSAIAVRVAGRRWLSFFR